VNAGVILVCALIGSFFIKGIPARFEEIIKKALGLAVIYIGIKGALDNRHPLLLILSMVIGAIVGEAIDIDRIFKRIGNWAGRKLQRTGAAGGNFSRAFVESSIIFCSGSMAIVGAMQSGLSGNHETLFAKSILDGSVALIFGATLGLGTAFSAIPVLLYQGGIAALSILISGCLSPEMIQESSAVGSLIIAAIGFNFLEVKEIKVANLIPAVLVPFLYFAVKAAAAS